MNIFISYRRDDSADVTGRIFDRLVDNFGKDAIFKDVDSIPFGVNFRAYLNDILGKSRILLVVIGPKWLDIQDNQGKRRLDDSDDFVRIEIEAALQRNIIIIPLLVSRASMPSANQLPTTLGELAFYNGTQIRPDPDFHRDMDRLIQEVEKHLVPERERKTRVPSRIYAEAIPPKKDQVDLSQVSLVSLGKDWLFTKYIDKNKRKIRDFTNLSLIELVSLAKETNFLSSPFVRFVGGAILAYAPLVILDFLYSYWSFWENSVPSYLVYDAYVAGIPNLIWAISGIIAYPHKKTLRYIAIGVILGIIAIVPFYYFTGIIAFVPFYNFTERSQNVSEYIEISLLTGLFLGVPIGAIISRIQHIRKII